MVLLLIRRSKHKRPGAIFIHDLKAGLLRDLFEGGLVLVKNHLWTPQYNQQSNLLGTLCATPPPPALVATPCLRFTSAALMTVS